MKKPKKTLKDLLRLEAMLTKQTERTDKLMSRRREKGDKDNPATNVFYARVGSRQKSALDDLSEIRRLVEEVSLKVAEAEESKAEAKASAKETAKAAKHAPKDAAPEKADGKSDEKKEPAPAKRAPRARKPSAAAQP